MLFWIVAGSLAALVAVLAARPLLAPSPGPAEAPEVAIYRGQLAEVERDVARGTLAPEEAERARTEIARRLLAADRAGPRPAGEAPRAAGLAGVAVTAAVLVMGSLALYAALGRPDAPDAPRAARLAAAEAARAARPSQAEAEAAAPAVAPRDLPADELAMIEELRRVVPTRPDDVQGWELLARSEARLGRYAEAARAQGEVVRLRGEAATADDLVLLLDLMVPAAGLVVTPEAEAVLARLAGLDPESAGGRYYAGLLHARTGRPDLAFPLWRAVVEDAPGDSLHRDLALAQIAEVAALAGADWTPPPEAGPTAEDVAAAADMDPAERAEMVRGMVEGLRERLEAEGGPAEDWARLAASLATLGDRAGAEAALAEGRAAHAGDAEAERLLDAAAARIAG